MVVTAATRAAAPFVPPRRGECCFFVPPQRWRTRPARSVRAGRWPGLLAWATDPQAARGRGAAADDAPMKKRLVAFMDDLSDMMRSSDSDMLRGTNPRDREKMIGGLEEQFSKTGNADKGLQLTQAFILLGNWRKAEATCQRLTNLYPNDPEPRLLSIVINVTRVMETLLSTDRTTTDKDMEEMANKVNEMTKSAIIDAWKKHRKK
ncbi:uncharacterized protein C2845_PM17G02580 [Panicum miliaceum]|uniref:Uncharacterized protein n=1 Tax=Panicum miliaceum TaxID=4540 RepID=A0A3L6Q1L6_PANMI|nr:uncharacterized protein C2845_PM17G02580 [Panicum miliaceum]